MIALVWAVLLAASDAPLLSDALQAIQAGRLEQARLILESAERSGVQGQELDRLRADLAFRSGNWAEASSRYEKLAAANPHESLTLERSGIAAFHLGDLTRASAALKLATEHPGASWRAWNARGAVADDRRDWAQADLAYSRALALAPDRPEVFNNRGWSLLLRGQWADALPLFERAAEMDPKSPRIANNLELARAGQAENLPPRRPGEKDTDWAARLNDAGVLAAVGGDRRRAIAAFAQAIELRSLWFERAANNLARIEKSSEPEPFEQR